MSLNRVLTDVDRRLYAETIENMQRFWPEMFSRKIGDSLVQFAFAFDTVLRLWGTDKQFNPFVLSAGSHEDIATECLKALKYCVVGIDPVWNCDLHTYRLRNNSEEFDFVVSASVLEHTVNDEEFVTDACNLLLPGGYGVFTMDFKDDWKPGQSVPYTSNRFYTSQDLTKRLRNVLRANGCDLVEEPDYSAKDRFVWDGINYGFATWVFKKG